MAQVVALGGEEGAQSVFISVYSIANCLGRLASGHVPSSRPGSINLCGSHPSFAWHSGMLGLSASGQSVIGTAWLREPPMPHNHAWKSGTRVWAASISADLAATAA